MFFFFPIGFGGGGFFGFLILLYVIRLIIRLLSGKKREYHYYRFDSEDFNKFNGGNSNNYTNYTNNSFNKNWYAVLGLDSSVSDDELKKTYRKLILKYHPDKFESSDPKQKEEATRKFREVQEAYENICKMRGIN